MLKADIPCSSGMALLVPGLLVLAFSEIFQMLVIQKGCGAQAFKRRSINVSILIAGMIAEEEFLALPKLEIWEVFDDTLSLKVVIAELFRSELD